VAGCVCRSEFRQNQVELSIETKIGDGVSSGLALSFDLRGSGIKFPN